MPESVLEIMPMDAHSLWFACFRIDLAEQDAIVLSLGHQNIAAEFYRC